MSINSIGGPNPDDINQPRRRTPDSQTPSEGSTREPAVHNGAYGQSLVHTNNYNISSVKVNDDDDAMQEVYNLDKEIYGEYSSYDSFQDFKNFISSNNLSTYVLKDGNGNIVGYYNLEPVRNGEMYIDSMGLKPECRNTRKGDVAIQTAWNKIQETAREKEADTLSLHADSSDTEQVDLYRQLGFQTEQDLPNYWGEGKGAYFMKYALNNNPAPSERVNSDRNVVFSKASGNDDEMRAIFDIDCEAFAEQDPFDSYEEYLAYLDEHQTTVYSVKDKNNELLGYYAVDPVNNGNMYIYSIALKPEYRNTREGCQIIQESWQKILEDAQLQGAEKLSLHVDAENPGLERLYERFGFETVGRVDNYYNNGNAALYMECPVPKRNEDNVESSADSTPIEDEPVQQSQDAVNFDPEPLSKEEEKYEDKVQKARQLLEEQQFTERTGVRIERIINQSTYDDKDGNKVFDNEIFDVAVKVAEICTDEQESSSKGRSVRGIMSKLIEKEGIGLVKVRKDVLPYLAELKGKNISTYIIDSILDKAVKADDNGVDRISTKILEDALYLAVQIPSDKKKQINSIMDKCRLKDKDGKEYYSREMMYCYGKYLYDNGNDISIEEVLKACTTKNEDGSEYFNSETFNMLNKYFRDRETDQHSRGIYSETTLEQVHNEGVTLDLYMKQAPKIMKDDVFKEVLRRYNNDSFVDTDRYRYPNSDVINTAAILSAISYRLYEDKTNYITGKKDRVPVEYIDKNAEKVLKEYCENGIPFDNIMSFARTMAACKEKPSPYQHEEFNPKILEKAIMLKNSGIDEKYIPKIIEACKLEETTFWGRKTRTFNDAMFMHVLIKCQQNPNSINPEKLKVCKDLYDGKERFRPDVLDILAERNVDEERNRYSGGLSDFRIKQPNGNIVFNKDLFLAWHDAGQPSVRIISEQIGGEHIPNMDAINAYKTLNTGFNEGRWNYKREDGSSNPVETLMYVCKDNRGRDYRWNNKTYEHIIDLIDKGNDGRVVSSLMYNCVERVDRGPYSDNIFMEDRYQHAMSLIDQGIDMENAGDITRACMTQGKIDNPDMDKMIELYNLGSKSPVGDLSVCRNNVSAPIDELAYERLKDALSRGLGRKVIEGCRDRDEFSDRLYHLAVDLQEKGYSSEDIEKFMDKCHYMAADERTGILCNIFDQGLFDHIKDLEDIGIEKDNVLKVLFSCKYGNDFSEEAFSKISELHNMQYDDGGIAKIIQYSAKDNKFSQEEYDKILEVSKRHIDLRDSAHGDDYIIEKLHRYQQDIIDIGEHFGEDTLNYAVSMKIDGYVNFVRQCDAIFEKCNWNFIEELKTRLNAQPSPELKVKRLRMLGGLATQVDQKALEPLLKLIKSPEMTEEQIELANAIFAPEINKEDYPEDMPQAEIEMQEYEKRVDRFIDEINTPPKNREAVRDFLMKERLDKSIDRPKSIEEQKEQMEKFAQQLLINPKIPLDKKIKYIDEYKAKLKDMDENPDKYLKQQIYSKPMEKLKQVIMAYVNIPNDDDKFNHTLLESMYVNMNIETTPEILRNINYDSKYFDKMFGVQEGFKKNFKSLIELKKMNMNIPFVEARMILPEENTEKYEQYQSLGLIEQIKANLDTKRQFEEHNLDFDKWNSYDENLRGETFTSEADPETEYNNLKYNVINIFQDELWHNINEEETKKLTEHLEKAGFKIYNNNLYKDAKVAEDSDIDNFINMTVQYISTNEYWKNVNVNSDLPSEEIAGVTGFTDHIKGFQRRAEEIRGAKTINNIHFRLTDENDIGRNIFFGNHVGCCNSVESNYAGYSAPMHLLNTYNRGLELVDEWGNSYGNSLCFFADVDGKLTFVIDSFEASGKLGSNPIVAEKMFEFAKKVCKEMGRPDAQIMVGPNYNHMDMSLIEMTYNHDIKILGTVSQKTYCDSIGGRICEELNRVATKRNMYVLKE